MRLLRAYRQGIFPWYEHLQPILWWSPDPRGVLYPPDFIVHKSLKKTLRKNNWNIIYDCAFREVMLACAEPRSYTHNTWITNEMLDAYCNLHSLGYAHSIEVRNEDNNLIGGVYGLSIGSIFFGESMFSRATDASKVALLYLCAYLTQWKYQVMDTQLPSAHLSSLGGIAISRSEYLELLQRCIAEKCSDGAWQDQQKVDIFDFMVQLPSN